MRPKRFAKHPRPPAWTLGFTTCSPAHFPPRIAPAPPRSSPKPSRSTRAMPTACLLKADQLIDGERYTEADQILKQVLDVNPLEARAWAYRAVLAHLRSDKEGEASARRSALAQWPTNPEVDHLIGRKLSQKYRFAEGAALQKLALALDPDYLPAKVQLCQDLLRLGDEAEGWKLAAEIFSKDGYNVVAYNLVTLRDRLAGFRTLEGDGFVVRMDKREADLYGPRVLALLSRARKTLVRKVRGHALRPCDCRDFSAAQGIRGANFWAARGRRSAGCLLRPRDHGQQPRIAGRASRRTGRPSCGMSFAMWSP